MTGDFRRGLSDEFLANLLQGPAGVVLQACQGAGLDVRLRDNYLNVYYRGRSLARVVGRGGLARLEIHHKYLVGDRVGGYRGRRGKHYCAFDVDAGFAAAYGADINTLIQQAQRYVGPEEDVELQLIQANHGSTFVCCFDRQVQVPGDRRKLDLMGVRGDRPALVAIEVKRYPDPRIQDVPQQLHEYLEVFDPSGDGLRADVAASYRKVCRQLRVLGQPAPDPEWIFAGMQVEGLVVVSDYNSRSRLLPRAHELAKSLPRPIQLWEPPAGEFVIPPASSWIRMGAS